MTTYKVSSLRISEMINKLQNRYPVVVFLLNDNNESSNFHQGREYHVVNNDGGFRESLFLKLINLINH